MTTALAFALAATAARSAIVTKDVDYEHNGVKLQGFLAYDDTKVKNGKVPGVLVVHEWWGLNDYVKGRAKKLAGLGFVAFALDMYGKGVLTADPKKAGELSAQFYGKPLMAERAQAGLDQLLASGLVDPDRVAAIGYCFGGGAVQALAYTGAPLAGIVSFHGSLIPATAETAAKVKGKILICHGALDPSSNPEKIGAYLKAMNDSKLDYQFKVYSGAYHAFTNPDADKIAAANPDMKGYVAYSPSADRRSWQDMRDFFGEVLPRKKAEPAKPAPSAQPPPPAA
jgi:dienelactone hydrolase